MTTFYICRHGQTENNLHQRFSGWIDAPLTAQGEQDARSAAAKLAKVPGLHLDFVLSSDLGRAFISAYIVVRQLGLTLEIERRPELREVNYGELANQPYAIYPPLTPAENTTFTPPGGESLALMQRRVVTFVRQFAAAHPDTTAFIMGHDGTINAIRALYLRQSIGQADEHHSAHDFVGKFTVQDGRVTSFEEIPAEG